MLFYNFNILDDLIKSNLINNLKTEIRNIKQIIYLYNNKKSNLLAITDNMIKVAESLYNNKLDNFYEKISLLKKSFENINKIQTLANKLYEDLKETVSLYDKGIENNKNEIKANLVEYNKQGDELFNMMLEFENNNTYILNSAIELSLIHSHKKNKKKNIMTNNITTTIKDGLKVDIEIEPYDSNVLLISEKEQKAYLPFLYSEIKDIYQNGNGKYDTMQDVVDDLYIVPLNRFKNSAIARFKEGFNLIRNKEKGSIIKSLDLALELMFRYELNPIVVAACRNLDELDIYLDCLENDELYDFNCFEIKFEVMPKSVTK